jgi:hypothetical protein
MRLAEFKDMNGKVFALSPNNIKEVWPAGSGANIVTYDNKVYDCRFSFDATFALINSALTDGHQYLTTTHRFPSCANR